ncbi:MAG: transposase [Pseudomonadales bacterium]
MQRRPTLSPRATIVADRFHVIRLVNQHFLKACQQHDPEGRRNRGLLSLMRRHAWNLSDEQQGSLRRYLAEVPVVEALYDAKQRLARFLLLKALNARTATARLEPIVAMWRFSRNNGITEGFHTKMEMMSRRAYGFRNFENYRLRVLTHCGWDGIINRV